MSEIRSVWNELDHNLSDSILKKLEEPYSECKNARGGLQDILSFRLVSKSWKAAAAEYTGDIVVEPQNQTDLHSLNKTLPNIANLHVKSKSAKYMEPVSAFNWLSSLSYKEETHRGEKLPLDMSLLPASLVDLKLSNCRIDPSSFQNLRSTSLTSLRLNGVQERPTKVCQLFSYLPQLQKFYLADILAFFYPEEPSCDLSNYLRSSSLTELHLNSGSLLFSPQLPVIATALQTVLLRRADTNAETLQTMCNVLPRLTGLAVHACKDNRNPTRTISGPATGVRSLSLLAVPPIFIQLAGPNLLSLKYMPDVVEWDQDMPENTVNAICNLTSLTRLELYHCYCTTRFSALQGLKLQELKLDSCPGAAQQILSNGTMSTLKKLHIWESKEDQTQDVTAFTTAVRETASPDHKWAQELNQLGKVVLSLPKLVRLSGSSLLFSLAMAEELRVWSEWKSKGSRGDDHWVWKKLT